VFRGRAQRRLAGYWFAALRQAAALDPTELPAPSAVTDGPPPVARWADRNPDAAVRLTAARAAVAAVAEEWAVPVENLLQPDLLRRLCWTPPADGDVPAALRAGGARSWQIDLLAPRLEAALQARS
jgi:ribonuclease D